jgi:hypothetical protein
MPAGSTEVLYSRYAAPPNSSKGPETSNWSVLSPVKSRNASAAPRIDIAHGPPEAIGTGIVLQAALGRATAATLTSKAMAVPHPFAVGSDSGVC